MEPTTLSPPTDIRTRYVFVGEFPRGRYRSTRTGQFVSWDTVRSALDETIENAAAEARSLSQRLQARTISLATWQLGMETQIKSAHLASFAQQRGGFQNLTPADYGRIGNILFNPNGTIAAGTIGQYGFLRRFAEQIEAGLPLDGKFLRRAELYIRAGRSTYHHAETLQMVERGFTEERYILNPADHCTNADGRRGGCVERAAKGWKTIGTLGGIGEMNCGPNDRCHKEYRNDAGLVWKPTT